MESKLFIHKTSKVPNNNSKNKLKMNNHLLNLNKNFERIKVLLELDLLI